METPKAMPKFLHVDETLEAVPSLLLRQTGHDLCIDGALEKRAS